jgi:hypothetical protein
MAMLFLGLLLVVPAFFAWTAIHELAHLAAAKWLVGAELVQMKLYPHVDPKAGFRWGSVQWKWHDRPPTDLEYAAIVFAPRAPDLVAVIAFPLVGLLPITGAVFLIVSVLLGAGLVDLGNGSMGINEHSDLRRGAVYLKKPPWLFRVTGFAVLLASAAAWLVLSVDQLRTLW